MKSRGTQKQRMLEKLQANVGHWVPLTEILTLGIAQYSARIFELRRGGYQIENRKEGDHSWFRLVSTTSIETDPKRYEIGTKLVREKCEIQPQPAELLFGDLSPLRYPD